MGPFARGEYISRNHLCRNSISNNSKMYPKVRCSKNAIPKNRDGFSMEKLFSPFLYLWARVRPGPARHRRLLCRGNSFKNVSFDSICKQRGIIGTRKDNTPEIAIPIAHDECENYKEDSRAHQIAPICPQNPHFQPTKKGQEKPGLGPGLISFSVMISSF